MSENVPQQSLLTPPFVPYAQSGPLEPATYITQKIRAREKNQHPTELMDEVPHSVLSSLGPLLTHAAALSERLGSLESGMEQILERRARCTEGLH